MIAQILSAIVKEITEQPMMVIAEFVQSIALVVIVWGVAIGFGNRRGMILNMLDERATHVKKQLEHAEGAKDELESARTDAEKRLAEARTEAERLRTEADAEVAKSEVDARASADAEAERIVERASLALTNERAQMLADLRDELVDLVSEATRSIMNEALTVAEQRDRIEAAIAEGITGDGVRG